MPGSPVAAMLAWSTTYMAFLLIEGGRRGPVGAKAVALPCCTFWVPATSDRRAAKARNIADNLSAIVHPS